MSFSKFVALCAVSVVASVSANALAYETSGTDKFEEPATQAAGATNAMLLVTKAGGKKIQYYFNSSADLAACQSKFGKEQNGKRDLLVEWKAVQLSRQADAAVDLDGANPGHFRSVSKCSWGPEHKPKK